VQLVAGGELIATEEFSKKLLLETFITNTWDQLTG
jgi:hypothetical protein